MIRSIIKQLGCISRSRWYWLFYIISGFASLAVALYFQYARDELPCIMCIQVRLLISLLIIVSFLGLLSQHKIIINTLAHFLIVFIALGLVDRSYQLLGTERGFIISDCGFSLGLPVWLAPDKWFPWLYGVETSCGYTPVIAFGITMAEALMVLSVGLFVVSFLTTIAALINIKLHTEK